TPRRGSLGVWKVKWRKKAVAAGGRHRSQGEAPIARSPSVGRRPKVGAAWDEKNEPRGSLPFKGYPILSPPVGWRNGERRDFFSEWNGGAEDAAREGNSGKRGRKLFP